jgi:hypothetical protein
MVSCRSAVLILMNILLDARRPRSVFASTGSARVISCSRGVSENERLMDFNAYLALTSNVRMQPHEIFRSWAEDHIENLADVLLC